MSIPYFRPEQAAWRWCGL